MLPKKAAKTIYNFKFFMFESDFEVIAILLRVIGHLLASSVILITSMTPMTNGPRFFSLSRCSTDLDLL
jgi:hypothetical protein